MWGLLTHFRHSWTAQWISVKTNKWKKPQGNLSAIPALGNWIYKSYIWLEPLTSLSKKIPLKQLTVHLSKVNGLFCSWRQVLNKFLLLLNHIECKCYKVMFIWDWERCENCYNSERIPVRNVPHRPQYLLLRNMPSYTWKIFFVTLPYMLDSACPKLASSHLPSLMHIIHLGQSRHHPVFLHPVTVLLAIIPESQVLANPRCVQKYFPDAIESLIAKDYEI